MADFFQLQLENLILNPATYEVRSSGELIELSHKEFLLLEFLLNHPNKVFSRAVLLEKVWGYQNTQGIKSNTVDAHISSLRRKLDQDSKKLIKTVHRVGYKIFKTPQDT